MTSRCRVALAVLALGLLGSAGGVLWAGHALTAPAHADLGAPPSELGIRPLTLRSASGALLSGWFVPGEPGAGAVLLLHSVRSNKSAMLGRARFLKALGFSLLLLLLLDLQAHGESGGEHITFGYLEARDVEAATARLMQLAPGERIGVLGKSLGAAATVLSQTKSRYAAVVLESLYPTIEGAIDDRMRLHLGAVGPMLSPLLLAQLPLQLGVRSEQLRPIEHVGEFVGPVLVVHGRDDRHTTLAEATRLYDAVRAPKSMYVVEGAAHVDLYAHASGDYEQRIGAFFISHLRALPAASTLVSWLE